MTAATKLTNKEIGEARRVELDRLAETHGGTITPAQVVAYAEDAATALHSLFTWDDSEAARKHREYEARCYLRTVCLIVKVGEDEEERYRAYVSLPSDRGQAGYRRFADVRTEADQYAELLADAVRQLKIAKANYKHLKELAPVWEALDEVAQ